jgi:hypothetical protein
MFIQNPDFYPSRIRNFMLQVLYAAFRDVYPGSSFLPFPDTKTATEEVKKIVLGIFFVAINFIKLHFFIFFNAKGTFSKNYGTLYTKIVTLLSILWIWDPGTKIRKKPIPNPVSRPGAKRQQIPDPQCLDVLFVAWQSFIET